MDETRELVVARLGAQGDGIAEAPGGPVYVPVALTGERVRVAVGEGGRARLIAVLEPAADRVAPVCRHFGTCGGCSLQHMSDAALLAWKREQVRIAFAQRGIAADVEPTVAITGRRRRAVFAARRTADGVVLGFHAARGHDVVGIAECPVLVGEIVAALPALARIAMSCCAMQRCGSRFSPPRTGSTSRWRAWRPMSSPQRGPVSPKRREQRASCA